MKESPPLRIALGWADKLVEEYLLFRGFMQTHRAFLGEVRHDRLQEFQVDKIVEVCSYLYMRMHTIL